MKLSFLGNTKGWFIGKPIAGLSRDSGEEQDAPVHDIANLLFLVKGMIEAHRLNIKEGIYDSENTLFAKTHETLDKIYLQVERAIRVTQRLRKLACLTLDGDRKKARFSLSKAAERAIRLAGESIILNGVEVINGVPRNLLPVRLCKADLEEILYNLVVNAVRAFGKKRDDGVKFVLLSAEMNRLSGAASKLVVQVTDSGPGIPKSELPYIFEPFFTTNEENGNGLGLFIVRQLVQRNGGSISVQSVEGEGTTFRLVFPL
ncbi:MAG: HAMP domain-containing sensor histidine kinase [Candidatus Omnitrophica bacterium]|nr:HAMP domain-containing sensor histidine kinase [Candidatus Omnitrophota bacterium]